MAFLKAGLRKFADGGALSTGEGSSKSLHHYVTNDADTVVEADAYFDATGFNAGDLIFASLDMDGTPEVKTYVVSVGSGDINDNDVTIVPMIIV